MAEYRQMSIYFDMEMPDEAWVYQYLMSLRHGKKAVIITALKVMLGKGEQIVPFSVQAMQPPGNSGKKKGADRQAFGRAAAKNDVDVGNGVGGVGEKQGGILTDEESKGSSDREPVESVLPDAMLLSAGKDISVQNDGKTESGWQDFFTQEQLAAILEKNLDMSQLTEDGIRQMAVQVQNGIPEGTETKKWKEPPEGAETGKIGRPGIMQPEGFGGTEKAGIEKTERPAGAGKV